MAWSAFPPASEASREVVNLAERKIRVPPYMVSKISQVFRLPSEYKTKVFYSDIRLFVIQIPTVFPMVGIGHMNAQHLTMFSFQMNSDFGCFVFIASL